MIQQRLFESTVEAKPIKLTERVSGAGKIDREAAIIHDVKLLGATSRNGRYYTRAAMEQATKLYDGVAVRLEHKPGESERSFIDDIGTLHDPYLQNDGVYAREFRLHKSHPLTALILERAEKDPSSFGFSHDANGIVESDGRGGLRVTNLQAVHSVDLVTNPATTGGLFESEAAVTDDEDATDDDEPVDEDDSPSGLDRLVTIINESRDDETALIEAIKALIKEDDSIAAILRKAMPAESPEMDDVQLQEMVRRSTGDVVKQLRTEVKTLTLQLRESEARASCQTLFSAAGVDPSPTQMQAALRLTESERVTFIDELAERTGGLSGYSRPRNTGAASPRHSLDRYPDDFSDALKSLKRLG